MVDGWHYWKTWVHHLKSNQIFSAMGAVWTLSVSMLFDSSNRVIFSWVSSGKVEFQMKDLYPWTDVRKAGRDSLKEKRGKEVITDLIIYKESKSGPSTVP